MARKLATWLGAILLVTSLLQLGTYPAMAHTEMDDKVGTSGPPTTALPVIV